MKELFHSQRGSDPQVENHRLRFFQAPRTVWPTAHRVLLVGLNVGPHDAPPLHFVLLALRGRLFINH